MIVRARIAAAAKYLTLVGASAMVLLPPLVLVRRLLPGLLAGAATALVVAVAVRG